MYTVNDDWIMYDWILDISEYPTYSGVYWMVVKNADPIEPTEETPFFGLDQSLTFINHHFESDNAKKPACQQKLESPRVQLTRHLYSLEVSECGPEVINDEATKPLASVCCIVEVHCIPAIDIEWNYALPWITSLPNVVFVQPHNQQNKIPWDTVEIPVIKSQYSTSILSWYISMLYPLYHHHYHSAHTHIPSTINIEFKTIQLLHQAYC